MSELTQPTAVHYLGPDDSYSGVLAEQLYPDASGVERVPQPSFRRITEALAADGTAAGLLPVENSTSSTIHENADAIFGRQISVTREALLAINVHLIGLEGSNEQGARRAYSHVQALAQCSKYLQARKLEEIETASTAAAADVILEKNDPADVCLGGLRIARRPGLTILRRDIANHGRQINRTKFFEVRARGGLERPAIPEAAGDQLKLTMVAELDGGTGLLWKYLQKLSVHDANLVTIESRPNPDHGDHFFWMDMEIPAANVSNLMETADKAARSVDVLGIYKPGEVYQS